jgi:hypothetical protein
MLVVDIPELKAHFKPVIQNRRLDIDVVDYRLRALVHHRLGVFTANYGGSYSHVHR